MDIERFNLLFKPFKHGFWKIKRCHGYRISLALMTRSERDSEGKGAATRARAKFHPSFPRNSESMFRTASAGRRALLSSSSPFSPSLPSRTRSLFSRSQPPPPNPFRTPFYVTVFLVGGTLFGVYYLDSRSALHRYVITPVLRYALDAETAHKVAVKALKHGVGPRDPGINGEDASLAISVSVLFFAKIT
jgi:hypothetical protein